VRKLWNNCSRFNHPNISLFVPVNRLLLFITKPVVVHGKKLFLLKKKLTKEKEEASWYFPWDNGSRVQKKRGRNSFPRTEQSAKKKAREPTSWKHGRAYSVAFSSLSFQDILNSSICFQHSLPSSSSSSLFSTPSTSVAFTISLPDLVHALPHFIF